MTYLVVLLYPFVYTAKTARHKNNLWKGNLVEIRTPKKPKDIFSSAVVELLHLEAYQFLLKHVPTFFHVNVL